MLKPLNLVPFGFAPFISFAAKVRYSAIADMRCYSVERQPYRAYKTIGLQGAYCSGAIQHPFTSLHESSTPTEPD